MGPPSIHLDFETRSTVDLKRAGVHVYSENPDTDVWCAAWSLNDSPEVQVWVPGEEFPRELEHALSQEGATVTAHNASFEYVIWKNLLSPRYGWPAVALEQMRCTMVMAYSLALPGSLENAALAVGLDIGKDMDGRKLMMQMARPRRIEEDGTPVWWDDPGRKERLYAYCVNDVLVEKALERRLLPLSKAEQTLWVVDQRINERGLLIDRSALDGALGAISQEKNRLDKTIKRVTGGRVNTCNQVLELSSWIKDNGVPVPTLGKADVSSLLKSDGLPDGVKDALLCRQEAAKASTAKLKAMDDAASNDQRVRGCFQFHGASTGRWAGRRIQFQNLPRGSLNLSEDDIAAVFDSLRSSSPNLSSFGPPLSVISDCLRGFIIPSPGHRFIGADFSSIEARVLAWLAGQDNVLDIFRRGKDIYCHAATAIYGRNITKEDKEERQIGKVAVLALGYGGGRVAFQSMAKAYGIELEEKLAEDIKLKWRDANPRIVDFWYALERSAMKAVEYPGTITVAGAPGRYTKFKKAGSFLFCQLPSKRCLSYPFPKIKDRETPWGATKPALHFMGTSLNKSWEEQHTYGGSLSENITQAVARDLLAEAILRLEAKGYPVVMHVHDELLCEVPEDFGSAEELEKIITTPPAWAENLPMEAEGWTGKRYRK